MSDTLIPLDASQVRALFPDAPEDLSVPRDVASLFNARIREVVAHNRLTLLLLNVILVGLGAALLASGQPAPGMISIIALAAFWITIVVVQRSKARKDFFARYAQARGLTLATDAGVPADTVPLLTKGDRRKCVQMMSGTICGAANSTLANYTYTEVTTDSNGNRQQTDHDYLILHLALPPEVGARFRGVYLNPAGWTLGALQDKFAKDRAVKLESNDFNKRYNLRVTDQQDEVALYELFSPPFIDALTTGPKVHWQQVGCDLVVYRTKHETEAMDLDMFVAQAAPIVQRYREEWR